MSAIVNYLFTSHAQNKNSSYVVTKAKSRSTHSQRLNQIYQLPIPLRVFPLPVFVPNNPVSLLHILYTWLSQIFYPIPSHITPIYQGWLSRESHSVHVTDTIAIRGLWEQGFYGKGSLSRSEPNWLSGERARRENKEGQTSEEYTRKRRAERQKIKWERARKERYAIEQQLSEEAGGILNSGDKQDPKTTVPLPQNVEQKVSHNKIMPPTGPVELCLLPNSQTELDNALNSQKELSCNEHPKNQKSLLSQKDATFSVTQSLPDYLPSDQDNSQYHFQNLKQLNYQAKIEKFPATKFPQQTGDHPLTNFSQGNDEHNDHVESFSVRENSLSTIPLNHEKTNSQIKTSIPNEKNKSVHFHKHEKEKGNRATSETKNSDVFAITEDKLVAIKDEEHLQLTFEEAFFLSYGLGCLSVLDPITGTPIPSRNLFTLCRQLSSFPPNTDQLSSSDDRFMINYVVYHHYRSLGWVVRSGIKFSVDYMLYNRGPVFSHAEFSVLILPSYSDPYWSSTNNLLEYSRRKQNRSWAWMSCINRVISQVKKTLVLCYVDIPRPLTHDEEESLDLNTKLSRYKIREFILSRFLANRMRTR